ncbi:MAG TPA: DUF2924 domain-containing protein [Mesorhizobium sp.]|jgi:hypothetical protein|nr:DUF2924 domain-containing protein [Mesorhizobium sp.]
MLARNSKGAGSGRFAPSGAPHVGAGAAAETATGKRGRKANDDVHELITTELAAIETLALPELRSRWLQVTGRPAPKAFRTEMMRRALAYEIQVAHLGGLSSATKRRLRQLAVAARQGHFDETLGASSIRPGTILVRVWQDQVHRVSVTPEGFVWNGAVHRSLSTIAKAITGTNWNGWTFFGLKRRPARNKHAAMAGGGAIGPADRASAKHGEPAHA